MADSPLDTTVRPDPWAALRDVTDARIALGRSGGSLPTKALLAFQTDHAMARDAIYTKLDSEAVGQALETLADEFNADYLGGFDSQADDRDTYLQRPDLGRKLRDDQRNKDKRATSDDTLLVVVADGLSATAVNTNACAFLKAWMPALRAYWSGRVELAYANQARVALADQIALQRGAKAVVLLIGERPGLSSPDSMGLYLTWAPSEKTSDAERNCISNIRSAGLSYVAGIHKLDYLLRESIRLKASGVVIKDRSDDVMLDQKERNFLLPGVSDD